MREYLGGSVAGPLGLRDVVQTVGSDNFGACLGATLHQQLAVDQVMVFQAVGQAPWRTLVSHNVRNASVAERLATTYTRHFWARDPKRSVIRGLMPKQFELQASEDLSAVDAEYRNTLFVEPDLVDKMSLFSAVHPRPSTSTFIGVHPPDSSGAPTSIAFSSHAAFCQRLYRSMRC